MSSAKFKSIINTLEHATNARQKIKLIGLMLTYFLNIAVNNVITNNPEPLKIIGYGIFVTNY